MVKASDLDHALRKAVKQAEQRGEDVTVKLIRSKVEVEHDLGEGFFKNDVKWKERSKRVIEAAFQEDEGGEDVVGGDVAAEEVRSEAVNGATGGEQLKDKGDVSGGSSKQEMSAPKGHKVAVKAQNPAQKVLEPAGANQGIDSGIREGGASDGVAQANSQVAKTHKLDSPIPNGLVSSPPKVNGVKRKAQSQEEEGSEEDTASNASSESPNKRVKSPPPPAAKTHVSGDEDSEESSDAEEETATKATKKAPALPAPKPSAAAPSISANLPPIPAKPFVPPQGYVQSTQLEPLTAFSSANLRGKEIWHLTLPSNFPPDRLTTLAFSAINSGKAVLEHEGIDYILQEPSTTSATATPSSKYYDLETGLLLPNGENYTSLSFPINESASSSTHPPPPPSPTTTRTTNPTRTLHLIPNLILPTINPNAAQPQSQAPAGSAAASQIALAATTTIRPQPRGLRMRYRPPGSSALADRSRGKQWSDSGLDSDDHEPGGEFPAQSAQSAQAAGGKQGPAKEKEEKALQFPRSVGGFERGVEEVAGGAGVVGDVTDSAAAVAAAAAAKGKARAKTERKAKRREEKAAAKAQHEVPAVATTVDSAAAKHPSPEAVEGEVEDVLAKSPEAEANGFPASSADVVPEADTSGKSKAKHPGESKEDRAKRKAEKSARKEAKRSAKVT